MSPHDHHRPESQAHNFISGAQEGIAPRTGLFSFAFPLATLSASENQAPFLRSMLARAEEKIENEEHEIEYLRTLTEKL